MNGFMAKVSIKNYIFYINSVLRQSQIFLTTRVWSGSKAKEAQMDWVLNNKRP